MSRTKCIIFIIKKIGIFQPRSQLVCNRACAVIGSTMAAFRANSYSRYSINRARFCWGCRWKFLLKLGMSFWTENLNTCSKHAETTPGFAVIVDKIEKQEQLCCGGKKTIRAVTNKSLFFKRSILVPRAFSLPCPPSEEKRPWERGCKRRSNFCSVDRLLREFCSIFIRKICLRQGAIVKVSHRVPADQKNRFSISETSEFSSTFDPTDEIN